MEGYPEGRRAYYERRARVLSNDSLVSTFSVRIAEN